jgi:hypothetical protein
LKLELEMDWDIRLGGGGCQQGLVPGGGGVRGELELESELELDWDIGSDAGEVGVNRILVGIGVGPRHPIGRPPGFPRAAFYCQAVAVPASAFASFLITNQNNSTATMASRLQPMEYSA